MKNLFAKYPWLAFLGAAVMAVSLNVAASRLDKLLANTWWDRNAWVGFIFSLLLFLASALLLYWYSRRFLVARSLSQGPVKPRPCLIMFISTQNPAFLSPDGNSPAALVVDGKAQGVVQLTGNLETDIRALNQLREPYWNWQQVLRAIQPHRQSLQRVHLIGSTDSLDPQTRKLRPGSYLQLSLCEKLVRIYLPDTEKTEIKLATRAVDFENFNELVRLLYQLIDEEKAQGRKERDIVIDVTGGHKTTSIAGASVTLNLEVVFQYVSTVQDKEVMAYDLAYQLPVGQQT